MSSVADAEAALPLPPAAGEPVRPPRRRPRRRPSDQAGEGGSGGAPRPLAAKALVALSVGVVGFFVAAQLGTTRRSPEHLAAESESDLTRIFASLNEESAALRDEISQLRLELAALQSSAERDQLARDAAERQLSDLQILAGVVPARGPGVAVHITDPKGAFEFQLLLDLVQELRDAGAEAIAVNGRRVGGTTAFSRQHDAVTVDGQEVQQPYDVLAIGDPATLEVGLRIPGGAVDTLDALDGTKVGVERRSDLRVPALDHPPAFKAAHPLE
ncbi:MAG: hypothetical protein QOD57_1025 [Actinomycetota bacterium]|jgi:uncharacterized protein YlxW (UPF0749 family)|nr:hypothetical protein [Actinomycetota bacterium]MDQ1503298.1 hypothetical protein [Actinomycetota bacterium]